MESPSIRSYSNLTPGFLACPLTLPKSVAEVFRHQGIAMPLAVQRAGAARALAWSAQPWSAESAAESGREGYALSAAKRTRGKTHQLKSLLHANFELTAITWEPANA